jgi:hypothetical protein
LSDDPEDALAAIIYGAVTGLTLCKPVGRSSRHHSAELYDLASRSLRQLDAPGASAPIWSADGQSLLYVARDALWLLRRLDGQPVKVTGALFPPRSWPAYYGQVDWTSQFAWWSATSSRTCE